MKPTLLLTVFFSLICFSAWGQVDWTRQSTENANATSSPGTAIAHDIGLSPNGGIYVTGECSGQSIFDPVAFPDDVYNAMFLAKYDGSGNLGWAVRMTGNQNDRSTSIATHTDGSVYIAGSFRQTNSNTILDFGNITLTGNTADGTFLAKADSNGIFLWATSILTTAPQNVIPSDIQVDPMGNVYVWGTMEDSVIIDGVWYNKTNGEASVIYLAKYLPNGTLDWFKHSNSVGGMAHSIIQSGHLAFGNQGQLYLNGNFNTLGSFGSTLTWGGDTIQPGLDEGQFLTRFTSDGEMEWWRSMDSDAAQYPLEMGVDSLDNVYLTFQKQGLISFSHSTANSNDYKGRTLLVKYNSSGTRKFIAEIAHGNVGLSDIVNQSVTVHTKPNGTTLVSGLYGSISSSLIIFGRKDTFPMPHISNDGARHFLTGFNATGTYLGVGFPVEEYITEPDFYWENTAMVGDKGGKVYMTGKFAGALRLGNDSLLTPGTSSAAGQAFTMKFDPMGFLDLTTSMEDKVSVNHQLLLYPNPATDNVTIDLTTLGNVNSSEVSLYHLNGKRIRRFSFYGKVYQMNITGLAAGMYLCRISVGGQTLTKRLVIK